MGETLMRILLGLCIGAGTLVPAKRALHMFQQNRYETGRYTSWINENLSGNLKGSIFPLGLVLLNLILALFLKGTGMAVAALIVCVLLALRLFAQEKKKTYIKPLVYTARVKRQTAVLAVLEVIVIVLVMKQGWYGLSALLGFFLPWVLIWPVGWITAPVEAAVRRSFLNDAKRILEGHTGLIKIGITGSFGKTSTKNIMQAMLSEAYNSLMTPASYNTPMGITRTIRENLKPIHQVFVCEMGADHVGDITELMNFVHPSIGVVTSIGPQHLNTFGSQDNITHEKMQEIELLPKDGFGVLNYDNPFIRSWKLQNPVETVTYGVQNKDTDYHAEDIVYGQNGSSFTVVCREGRFPLQTKLLGELNILNILSAVAVARHLGVEWKVITRAVRNMKPVEHRLEPKRINGYRFIDDAFNANPTGSAMALEVLSGMPGRRYIVTPGMIDLGEKQAEINRHFGTLMKDKADIVVLVGKNQTAPIYEGLQESGFNMDNVAVLDTEKEAFAFIWQSASPEDTILLENDLPDAFNH
jgi:UDP-N-acetylmuramoyl-tripeptide--D-alanyl-D-alanine ligase